MARAMVSVGICAGLLCLVWVLFQREATPSPRAAVVDPTPPPVEAKVEDVVAPMKPAPPPPETRPLAPPPTSRPVTRIAPGTPARFLNSYIQGYVPVEILADGTQLFEDLPCKVKQADGTMKEQRCSIRVNPTAPKPLAPDEQVH